MNGIKKDDLLISPEKSVLADLSLKDIKQLENYYVAEAERLMMFFEQEKEDALFYMKRHLGAVEALFRELQFPWEDCIPMLYGCFMHYIVLEKEQEKRKHLSNLMIELINRVKFFSKKSALFMGLERRIREQRQEVEALIALRNNGLDVSCS